MGWPAIAGLALSAAGTGVGIANAQATRDRMNDVLRRQLAAQDVFQGQAAPEFQKSLGASGAEAARRAIGEGTTESSRLYSYLQNLPQGSAAAPSPIAENQLVDVRNQARIGQSNLAQAALQGFGNFDIQRLLAQQRGSQNLGAISVLSGSRAGITPSLLQGAQNQGQDLAAIGSLLGTAGSLAGVYGSLSPYLQATKGT